MHIKEYRRLYNKLNIYSDIEKVAKSTGYDKEMLLVLYTQKVVRKATSRFYKVKNRVPELHGSWKKGKTILELSRKLDFPPVLLGLLVLTEEGIGRKTYRNILNDLNKAPTPRIREELKQVIKKDSIYSPKGYQIQFERGKFSEQEINDWLESKNVTFKVEAELRNNYPKTPDFLLDKPLNVRGTNIHWIESKATFGDAHEIHKNLKSQLKPYKELFGPGMVIYWFGFITPSPLTDGILIESKEFLEDWKE
jgi:hypothetical protein